VKTNQTVKNESRGLSFRTTSVRTPNESHMRTTQAMWWQSKLAKGRKHGSNPCLDPMRIAQAHGNRTVKLVKVADDNGGAVSQTWNIRNIEPRMA